MPSEPFLHGAASGDPLTAGRLKVRGAVLREMGRAAPYARSRPLEICELELAGPGPGELLVRIRAAGLCHSDLSVIDGSRPRVMPMVLGHEASGEVVGTGEGVGDFAAGDRVVLTFVPSCGHCPACLDGRAALCEPGAVANTAGELLGGGRRWGDLDGHPLHHHLGVSAFADHVVVSARSAVRVGPDLPFEVAAVFGCAVLTGAGAALHSAEVGVGESVAVFGLGGVGLAALLGAVAAGATTIVAVDTIASKLDLARELGATHAVPAGEAAVAQVRELTGGGAHKAIETVGNERVLADAYAATRRGGTTVTVGLPDPSRMLTIPAVSLVTEERTLRGSYLGSSVPARDVPRFVDLYAAGRLPVDRLLTHRLTLDEINEGFDRLARGEAVRQAVVFD
ncbi:zinc-dependent alcohol dehydrogenase family protein [Capillimicrobium parvum]|uniref:Alcohol dehydrogenase D n=1 Tax=Capillimicrobium parvum TaxID=2884022 RepID=A0A9E7C285_9ACTN|nr:zinc-dependent alcohol dehydrogenase family protein [Capillimicrobium parvum]UGS37377.1 Putative alcohol dehydrogenase D [Capillimicrobium parvum]